MPLTSDLTVDDTKFDAAKTTIATASLNDRLIETQLNIPKWYEVCVFSKKQSHHHLKQQP